MSLTRKKPMRRVSRKRAKANKEYTATRKAFLALRPLCEVWRELAQEQDKELSEAIFGPGKLHSPVYSQDVHHVKGRLREHYLDSNTWMAVSRLGHAWIHAHPKEARARGWLQ
jgi:hypothetical protein